MQSVLSPSRQTLPEILRRNGYRTAAVVSNTFMHSIFGLGQSFDVYDDHVPATSGRPGDPKRRAEDVNRSALEWLRSTPEEPFFLLVHYNDPHWPYLPPPPYGREFVADYDGPLTPEKPRSSGSRKHEDLENARRRRPDQSRGVS